MSDNERNIATLLYRLLSIKGVGPVQANRLLAQIHAYGHGVDGLATQLSKALTAQELSQWNETEISLAQSSYPVEYLSVLDSDKYPRRLMDTLKQNTPTVLSVIGNQELLNGPSAGFSGSRRVSEKGLWITADCASQMVKKGVTVVSGYANGVDFTAHKTALEQGGRTIIVLPEGINSFYIRKELKPVWDWNRVLVISEFMPNDKWMASRAMRRNQTIIGLSDTMLVIEAGETGGSLDVGMKTISYGKSLFVPYYATVPLSAMGNNILLRHGANSLRRSRQSNCTNLDGVWTMMASGRRENVLF